MKTAILVTGGAGYVGSHACKALAAAGYLPVVLDNFSTGHADFVRWGPQVKGDIADSALVAETITRHGCAGVMHFAAASLVGESVSNPGLYYANNVGGTLGLLEGMRQAGCRSIVFSSTCAIYGDPGTGPITEATAQAPISPYGASKQMVERVLRDFHTAHGLNSICLRYFNACGASEDAEIGEMRDPETHLIPRAMMSLLGRIRDFAVHGSDYPTADGTAIRDYIHVRDLAQAHVLALGALFGGKKLGAYNLGSGRGASVLEVLNEIERVTGRPMAKVSGARRAGDPPVLVADGALARQELGFTTRHSAMSRIIESSWRWHLKAHGAAAAPQAALAA
ncbi:UDP-glucose 4-epimerase GalE [Rhodovarius crocodyli]|uniref:UDP-glucose 4-epimerase n=1 Tax=Rhodovarius crocodyli TaxID=1979269 RepID=A0A437MGG6_9PROT|nr:UDP-glucose 4-epimerase GalE [Rhodovarius crocodyli]RVT96744.1 UDP-glucose 4-epimerase GalE [Rhodovarius crocodyli]